MKHIHIARLGAGFLLLLLLFPGSLAFAKGAPDKITITGPDLAGALEMTDLAVLQAFDPWRGQFINWGRGKVTEEPPVNRRYEVLFHIKGEDSQFRVIYAFQYAPNPSNAPGYIYLPGREDERYDVNARTILRPTGWHYASAEWDSAINPLLREYATSPTSSTSAPRSIQTIKTPWVVGLAFAATVGVATAWLFRRSRPTPG